MPAYLIVNYNVENTEQYGEYSAAAGPVLQIGEKAKLVAFDGDSQKLEGAPGHQTVVLAFDSMDEAKEAYHSGEYQKLAKVRLDATSNHFAVLVNGIG
ncbi:MAG: DUF1330 domain-containing protein [Myxococcota bacterium]|nr:hypothetical protein [Deltaproteobacteria bacterium]